MTKKQTGGPAFPCIRIIAGDNYSPPKQVHFPGMTLRDHFAGLAMHALLSLDGFTDDAVAHDAYFFADKMIKARGE